MGKDRSIGAGGLRRCSGHLRDPGQRTGERSESRYAFMLLVTKEEDSTSASIILCERKFPHKIPTWDDLMDFQKKIAEENGWVSARIISANRQTDYDYDEDENDIVGDYEGGGADGAE